MEGWQYASPFLQPSILEAAGFKLVEPSKHLQTGLRRGSFHSQPSLI